jgi:acyl-CoA dehydrogenase
MLSFSQFIESMALLTNEISFFTPLVFLIFLVFIYHRLSSSFLFFIIGLFLLKFNLSQIFWISYLLTAVTFSVKFIRRFLVTKSVIIIIKKLGLLPKISETERIALTSGNTWIDSELFSGNPNFDKIFNEDYNK